MKKIIRVIANITDIDSLLCHAEEFTPAWDMPERERETGYEWGKIDLVDLTIKFYGIPQDFEAMFKLITGILHEKNEENK